MNALPEAPYPQPRPEIQRLPPVVHGALDFAELEHLNLNPDQVLDFSVNCNAYGPSPAVLKAISQVRLDRYPDREAWGLRRALADHLKILVEQVLVGNGTAELIWLVAMAYLRPEDQVLVIGPTFSEYAKAASLMGARIHWCNATLESGFIPDLDQIRSILLAEPFRLVFICTPNNPTGQVCPFEALVSWAQETPQTLFVVDEAYINFAGFVQSAIPLQQANILVLRSMTKDYALAGLRLGYTVGDQAVIKTLAKVRPPWSVNALAQAAGVAAMEDQGHLWGSQVKLRRDKQVLTSGLERLGYHPLPSPVNFFLLPVGNARVFRSRLLVQGILVRDCTSFGLPTLVRISTRTPEENAQLVSAIQGIQSLEE